MRSAMAAPMANASHVVRPGTCTNRESVSAYTTRALHDGSLSTRSMARSNVSLPTCLPIHHDAVVSDRPTHKRHQKQVVEQTNTIKKSHACTMESASSAQGMRPLNDARRRIPVDDIGQQFNAKLFGVELRPSRSIWRQRF